MKRLLKEVLVEEEGKEDLDESIETVQTILTERMTLQVASSSSHINMCIDMRVDIHGFGMCYGPSESSRRGGHFESRQFYTRGIDMPSAMPDRLCRRRCRIDMPSAMPDRPCRRRCRYSAEEGKDDLAYSIDTVQSFLRECVSLQVTF